MPQLKVIRAERQRREELLALAELRASVQALQQVDSAAQEQRQEVPVILIRALVHTLSIVNCIGDPLSAVFTRIQERPLT